MNFHNCCAHSKIVYNASVCNQARNYSYPRHIHPQIDVFSNQLILRINSDLKAYGEWWGLRRGMDGGSSCCRCWSPVWGSYCSASCAYAGLTSNVEQIQYVFNRSRFNLYLFACLYVTGHRVVIVACSLWSRPCNVV